MPIYQRNLKDLQGGANQVANTNDKLRELLFGKDVELSKAQDMLPIQQQQEQQKSDIAVAQKQQEQANAIEALKGMRKDGMLNEGGGATVNGVGVTRGYDPNRMIAQQRAANKQLLGMTKDLNETADNLEKSSGILDQMDGSPNLYDQKNFAVWGARLAEGNGQRLLQSVIDRFGADSSTWPGAMKSAVNKITGGAMSTLTPDEINAIRDHTQKQAAYYNDRLDHLDRQFRQQAHTIPLVTEDQINGVANPIIERAKAYRDKMAKRQAASQAAGGPEIPVPQTNRNQGGLAGFLGNLLGGGQKAAAPVAPKQGGLSPDEQAELDRLRAKHGGR